MTFSPSRAINVYAGYSEGSRAATSIELGCADPEEPCKLPNAMAGDPPLEQVVTRTLEARRARQLAAASSWNAGVFRAENRDDILFVTSEQTGFGYFRNFGETRRQGLELGAHAPIRARRPSAPATRSSTRRSRARRRSTARATARNDAAEEGEPGLEGSIEIEPGDRMPLIPRHLLKVFADVAVTSRAVAGRRISSRVSSSFARGNENNRHEPDGIYYLGPGRTPGYAIVNLGGRYRLTPLAPGASGRCNNLFDRRYYTAAQLGPLGFTDTGAFIARPFPPVDGEFPLRHGTLFAPGAPIRMWLGARVTF